MYMRAGEENEATLAVGVEFVDHAARVSRPPGGAGFLIIAVLPQVDARGPIASLSLQRQRQCHLLCLITHREVAIEHTPGPQGVAVHFGVHGGSIQNKWKVEEERRGVDLLVQPCWGSSG